MELFAYFMLYHEITDPGEQADRPIAPVQTELGDDQMSHNKCPIGRWLREWRDDEVGMFLEELGVGRDKNNPELQDRLTTLARWGTKYSAQQMFAIWQNYVQRVIPDDQNCKYNHIRDPPVEVRCMRWGKREG